MHYFWGIIGILTAYLFVRYRYQIIRFTGPWSWAERYLGAGGTATGILIFAILIFLFALSVLSGRASHFFEGTLGKFF